MDEMHISGGLVNMLAESLIKRWAKKRFGIDGTMSIQKLDIDLSGDNYSVEFKATGTIPSASRKNLVNHIWKKGGA